MERVITYIDGFNLYFGLKSKGWRRFYWLDVHRLSLNLLRPNQQLDGVKYFTSRVSDSPRDPGKDRRQAAYLEAVETLPLTTCFYGHYLGKRMECRNCHAVWQTHEEKMTDVNVAVEMLTDAYRNSFDVALLISGDSDLSGPIERIKELFPTKRVIGAFNLALAAWRRVGHCKLPAMNLACSGLAPNTREADWLAIAGDDQKLQRGMERLYRLFQKAAVLGSLINPRAGEGDLLVAAFHELQPLLEKALAQETKDDTAHEMAVTARGLAKAAEILAGQFTLVATNVPYLSRSKQDDLLREYCDRHHGDAKNDLATCFVERCLSFCAPSGSFALVTPTNWMVLSRYQKLRENLLGTKLWNSVVRLGPGAFETIGGEVVNVALLVATNTKPNDRSAFCGIDVGDVPTPAAKASNLLALPTPLLVQSAQLENPDARFLLEEQSSRDFLKKLADSRYGLRTGDLERLALCIWELPSVKNGWRFLQGTVDASVPYSGKERVILWMDGKGPLRELADEGIASIQGADAWGRKGVAVSLMGSLPSTIYTGEIFDNGTGVIWSEREELLPAIFCFCSSPDFNTQVRKIDQSIKVTNQTLLKVPFDLAHWQKVAAEKYPHGLPKPFSSDPTQWLFNGHPAGADQPLHVAVARLLGYQWPRQTGSSFPDCPALKADGLEKYADDDGIVCLSPVRGERAGAARLHTLLSAALGTYDEHDLITTTGSNAKSLDAWLRDEFFAQHCALFHQRPFIWHIWDGRSDGFHALVNYHKLAAPKGAGRKLLETLTFSYLGDWIRKQQDDAKRGEPGAEDRQIAAQTLQDELKAILAGEPPYDLFVRWKPLHQQPIGWEPDINDGVRLNIRPFLAAKDVGRKDAGILRFKPNVKWDKDRGKEPARPKADFPWFWSWDETTIDFPGGREFDGNRWNDCHYTPATKRAARAAMK